MTNEEYCDSFLTSSAGAVSKEALDRVIGHKPIDHEKLAFIRETAMRLYIYKDCIACDAWRRAQWLWNEKPDDC